MLSPSFSLIDGLNLWSSPADFVFQTMLRDTKIFSGAKLLAQLSIIFQIIEVSVNGHIENHGAN